MIARLLALSLLSAVLSTPALAGRRPQAAVVDDALAFAEMDRTKATRLLQDALTAGDLDAEDRIWVELNLAEQLRLAGNTPDARTHFTAVVAAGRRAKLDEAGQLGLALLDKTAAASLPDPDEKLTPETLLADRHLALALAAAAANDPDAVRDHTRRAITFSKADPQVEARVRKALDAIRGVETPRGPGATPTAPPMVERTLLEQARDAFEANDGATSRSLALAAKAADPAAVAQADALLEMLDAGTRVQPNRVGVLLPLEGKYGSAGSQVQASLELGYSRSGAGAQLVVRDSGSTAESAEAAFRQLVVQDGVIAVVGPLLTPETDAVVNAAERYGVPLLSLSQALEDSATRDWTVQTMVSADHQVHALVAFVMGQRDMHTFGIFAPDNNYGHRSAEVFRADVVARGGAITVETFYDPVATDLIPYAKTLGRKDYKARAGEFRQIKHDVQARGGNPDRVVLPPTIDFDALFIPDSATRVPLAGAALAYEEFPVGDFQPVKGGVTVPLLGLSGWHNAEIVSRGGEYTRGGYFVDAFAELDPSAVAFANGFRDAIGHSPSALEAITADVGTVLGAALAAKPTTRSAFRAALREVPVPATATGIEQISPEDGVAKRQLRVLSINKDTIYQVFPDPSPATPCAEGDAACASPPQP